MRLGLHIHTRDRRAMVRRYIDEVRPPVMKWLVDGVDPDMMRHARSLGIKVVLRRVADPLAPGATGGRVLEGQVLTMADQYRGCFDYVEAANEEMQGKDDPKEFDKLAELMLDFMQVCDRRGHKACVFNFSVGQPEIERWTRPSMLACLDYAARNGHAIGIHEYYKPVPWQGTEGWAAEGNAGAEGWWMLRIVKALKILRARGVAIPRIIVTESGRDDVSGTPGTGKGWRDDRAADFAEYMTQYCKHLRFHPEILGVVDFGAVSDPNGDERWHHFDLTAVPDVFERMIQRMKTIPLGGATVPTPQPLPPAPTPDPFAAHLSARLGGRFSDVRGALPRHPSQSYGRLDPARLVGIAVHHSASSVDTTPEAIARHHVDGNGWAGIGYHLVIRRGHVYYVGDLTSARAHVAGRNHELVGICVTGDYSGVDPASADTTALRDLIGALDAYLGRALPVDGHLGWATPGHGTACPGRLLVTARDIRPIMPTGPDAAAMRAAAAAEHAARGIRLNPGSAIQRTILADGLAITINEITVDGVVVSRGESTTAGVWIYWWSPADGKVRKQKVT